MQRISRIMMYGGVIAIVLALSKIHAKYVAATPYVWHSSSRFEWSIAYILLLCICAYGLGLPDLVRSNRTAGLSSVSAALVGALTISAVQLVVGNALLPRFVVFGSVLVLCPWYFLSSMVASWGHDFAGERDRVLLVGDSGEGDRLRNELSMATELPAQLVSVLAVGDARSGEGRPHPLVDEVVADRISVLVLSSEARADESVVAQAATLHEQGVRVRTVSLFYEQWMAKLPLAELERVSLMFDIGEVHRRRYARASRLIDLPIALVGTAALAVVSPFVVVINLLANRGPLLYRQQRVGKDGVPFTILKYRTMRVADEGAKTDWTQQDDPRITSFGRVLRKSHVDELPQFLNILKGDLAVVGPRPEQPRYVAQLREQLPFYDLRHLVHPGLTGWAQVKYGYAGDEQDTLEKLQYEFFYLRHQSVTFDLQIMGRTIRSVLGRAGR